jgi:hypothetical protein
LPGVGQFSLKIAAIFCGAFRRRIGAPPQDAIDLFAHEHRNSCGAMGSFFSAER